MRSLFLKFSLAAALGAGILSLPCRASNPLGQGQVTLTWVPSISLGVTSYNLCWGTSSGLYTSTNNVPATQTSGAISNLLVGQIYYVAAQSVSAAGASAFSTEVSFTYSNAVASGPPTPVFVASTNGSGNAVVSGNGGNGSSLNPTSGASGSTAAGSLYGVPPFLTMTLANGQPSLTLGGNVGATLWIQSTTNPLSMNSWETVTNVTLTNIDTAAQNNQAAQAQNLLNVAFVPASQACPLAMDSSLPYQFYRAVMPYDYVILANVSLTGQGYAPKLILVNMPGYVDDACYANEASSFICYQNPALELVGSGPSIRQIANALAATVGMNWTTASQFTYNTSNGLAQILATVVETEAPSSDPVPGQSPPSAPIAINF